MPFSVAPNTILSFDCFGTLIDWERGILDALSPILAERGKIVEDNRILEMYAAFEVEAERGEYVSYRDILRGVMRGFDLRLGLSLSPLEYERLAETLPTWPVFSDTVAALRILKSKCRLAIVSNCDNDLLSLTIPKLEVDFDFVVSAEMAQAYKPSEKMFRFALSAIGHPGVAHCHVAQSVYHDIVPATELGLRAVWIDRRGGHAGKSTGAGATPSSAVDGLAIASATYGDLISFANDLTVAED